MSNNKIKEKNKHDIAYQELTVNRLMILFVSAVITVVALLLFKKYSSKIEYFFVLYILPYVQIAMGALLCGMIALKIYRKVKRIDDSRKLINSSILIGIATFLLIMLLFYKWLTITTIIISIILVTLLCFICSYYPLDFSSYSIACAIFGIMLYSSKNGFSARSVWDMLNGIFKVGAFILPILVVIVTVFLAVKKGVITSNSKKRRVFPEKAHYYPFWTASLITLAGAAVSVFVPGILIYSLLVLLGSYLVIAIVYTVKMI